GSQAPAAVVSDAASVSAVSSSLSSLAQPAASSPNASRSAAKVRQVFVTSPSSGEGETLLNPSDFGLLVGEDGLEPEPFVDGDGGEVGLLHVEADGVDETVQAARHRRRERRGQAPAAVLGVGEHVADGGHAVPLGQDVDPGDGDEVVALTDAAVEP